MSKYKVLKMKKQELIDSIEGLPVLRDSLLERFKEVNTQKSRIAARNLESHINTAVKAMTTVLALMESEGESNE